MSDHTKIEWADATANYVNGCSVVSPGCTNCYAMRLAGTRMKDHPTRTGLTDMTKGSAVVHGRGSTKSRPVWNGTIRTNDKVATEVLGWAKPRRIFWNAHGDLFHGAVDDDVIDRQFAVMALTPQHIHMVLTKRPERMRNYLTERGWSHRISDIVNAWPANAIRAGNEYTADCRLMYGAPLPNVWLGTSVEDQTRADERIPALLATPAAVRFISAEPLLGPVDLYDYLDDDLGDPRAVGLPLEGTLDWVIVGGESGPNARPMHPDWACSLRDQCAAAGVPFHFKQWGEWIWATDAPLDFTGKSTVLDGDFFARVGKARAGRLLDGLLHDGFPS